MNSKEHMARLGASAGILLLRIPEASMVKPIGARVAAVASPTSK